eukprot:8387861-Karenia_brevis.AAC.1
MRCQPEQLRNYVKRFNSQRREDAVPKEQFEQHVKAWIEKQSDVAGAAVDDLRILQDIREFVVSGS